MIRRWFIPARAGNIISPTILRNREAVHPRPCGEHSCGIRWPPLCNGSSPPVRGTFYIQLSEDTRKRFIPARAGNISPRPAIWMSGPVHPRPCGEHGRGLIEEYLGDGSSPPVRGTSITIDDIIIPERFIPARAGNIRLLEKLENILTVHPRPCGEHIRSTSF